LISQEVIAVVVDSQYEIFKAKETGFEREILIDLPIVDAFAIIITGIRRCGKSTLLLQLLKKKYTDAFYLNFEDIRLAGFETADFTRLNAEVEKRGLKTLFFDEIQLIEAWERFVNQKLNEGYRVFITGSNASLLSKELGTHLTGRHLSTELFPFSYREFVLFKGFDFTQQSFDDYLKMGGFPEYLKSGVGTILRNLLDDILVRDIAVRYGIRDLNTLRLLTIFLITNIGKPISARSLANTFSVKSASTITEYFTFLQNACLIDFVSVFDYSLKKQIRNPRKVYITDLGIFDQVATKFTEELGRKLENAVFLHLRRKSNEIYYFKNEGECDFVVMDRGKYMQAIQVCYHIDDMNMQREMNGLLQTLKFFNSAEGTIVTHNQKDVFEKEGKIIRLVPAHEYLSGS
jgi:uncharacterized protein